jgi:hypothetical protein
MKGHHTVTTNRTDIHSPTNVRLEEYSFVGAVDLQGYEGARPTQAMIERRHHLLGLLRNSGSGIHSSQGRAQCDHCGAHLRYIGILRHNPTGTHIQVGEVCLDSRFSGLATPQFQALRKAAELDRAQHRIRQAVEAFTRDNPDLAWMAQLPLPDEYTHNSFLVDVAHKLRQYGDLSERQIAAVRASVQREQEFQARKRERLRAAGNRTSQRPHANVPTGRVEITGEVYKVRFPEPEDAFPSTKVLIADDRGFRVWGTLPSSLDSVQRGDRVSLVATVQVSKNDLSFGFYSRPTNGRLLAAASEAGK